MLTALLPKNSANLMASTPEHRNQPFSHTTQPPASSAAAPTCQQPHTHENTIIKSRWKLSSILGKGAFGEVYLALDLATHTHVAIKVESPACKKPVLKLEISILQRLQTSPYICRFIACGRFLSPKSPPPSIHQSIGAPSMRDNSIAREPTYSYLVMELLGSNLSDIRKRLGGKFSIATTALLAKQMLHAIEAVHSIGILHRDIKPGNFCLAAQDSPHVDEYGRERCFLIDFGLARRYLSSSGRVREPRSKVGFRGTARYASIAAHQGIELCRADDLWSLFYIIVEFLRGTLPWKGKEKERIGEMKQAYTNESLIEGLPQPVHQLYAYLTSLTYSAAPDYQLMSRMMDSLFDCAGVPRDTPYDWNMVHKDEHPSATVSTTAVPLDDDIDLERQSKDLAMAIDIKHVNGIAAFHPNQPYRMEKRVGNESPDDQSIAQITNNNETRHTPNGNVDQQGIVVSNTGIGGCVGMVASGMDNSCKPDTADVYMCDAAHQDTAGSVDAAMAQIPMATSPPTRSMDQPTAPCTTGVGRDLSATADVIYKTYDAMDASGNAVHAPSHNDAQQPSFPNPQNTFQNPDADAYPPNPTIGMPTTTNAAMANQQIMGVSFTSQQSSILTPSAASFSVSKTTSTFGPMVIMGMGATSSTISGTGPAAMLHAVAPPSTSARTGTVEITNNGSVTAGTASAALPPSESVASSFPPHPTNGEHVPTFMSTMIRSLSLSRADTGAASNSSSSGFANKNMIGLGTTISTSSQLPITVSGDTHATSIRTSVSSNSNDTKHGASITTPILDASSWCPRPPMSQPPQSAVTAQHIRSRRFRLVQG